MCIDKKLISKFIFYIVIPWPVADATVTQSLGELINIVTVYAAKWKVIGTLLGLPSGKLNSIEAGWPTNAEWCCYNMLEAWLNIDTTASWQKIQAVIAEVSGIQASVSKGE